MPKKILTIDDDPYIVKYITEVLSDNGYATCSASSVEEALSVLECPTNGGRAFTARCP